MRVTYIAALLGAATLVHAQMPVPTWLLPKIQHSSAIIQIAMQKEALAHPEGAYEATLRETPIYTTLMDHNLQTNWAKIVNFSKMSVDKVREVFRLPTIQAAAQAFGQVPAVAAVSEAERKELAFVQERMLDIKQVRNPSLCYAAAKVMTECGFFQDHTIALLAYRTQVGCAQGSVASFLNYEVETEIYQNAFRCDAVRDVLHSRVAELNQAIVNIGEVVSREVEYNVHHNAALSKNGRLVKRGLGKALAFSVVAFPIWIGASIITQGSIIPTFLIIWGFLYALSLGDEKA